MAKWAFVYNLKHPIKAKKAGKEFDIGKLKFPQRVRAKHLRKLPESFYQKGGENLTLDEVIPLIAGLTGMPVKVIDEVDLEDLLEIAPRIESFFGKSLTTGSN